MAQPSAPQFSSSQAVIDELAAQRSETFEGAFLVDSDQPRIPRDISG